MKTYSRDTEELLGPPSASRAADAMPLPSPAKGGSGDLAFVGGAYDGAKRFDTSISLWQPSTNSADGDILPDKPILDARARDTVRNDAYVNSGVTLHKDNIVGSMFLLNSKPKTTILGAGFDETWEEEFQEEVESKFTLYAESPNNWIDASRMNDFTGLVRLAVGLDMGGGEVLATAEWDRDPARPFNTAIQMVDTDRLSNPEYKVDTTYLRGGVQKNTYGAPQGYHIRMAHPADFYSDVYDQLRWKYVPATKPWGRIQVIHIMEQLRVDQSRGVSAMVAALKELRITKKFRDVVLQNAVVQSTFAASIESELPEQAFQSIGAMDSNGVADYASQFLGAVNAYSGGAKNLVIDGIKIPHLFPGTKLQMRPAGPGGPLGTEFEASLLRYIAANLGVSYEQLSRDYSNSNYSSVRAALTETWRYMQSRKRMTADRFASYIFRLWLEEAIMKNQIDSFPLSKAPMLYEGGALNLKFEALTHCDWIGASRGQIDELKETQAAVLRLKYNLSTDEMELARQGLDFRQVYKQRAREKKMREALGIEPELKDNMMNATTGAPRDKSEPGSGGGGETGADTGDKTND